MKKAVIYARYSSDRQTEQSIEGQLRNCRAFADSEGIDIVDEYIDRAISGTTDNRYYYKCGCKKLKAELLEKTVLESISQYLSADNCSKIANAAYQLYQKERKENPELQSAKQALKSVTQRLDNAVEAVLSGLSSNTIRNAIPELESRKAALEQEIRRLSLGMPDLRLKHFEYFIRKFAEFEKSDPEKQRLIDTLVCRVIAYQEQLVILINVTDTAQIPPKQQISAALEGSCNDLNGGGDS